MLTKRPAGAGGVRIFQKNILTALPRTSPVRRHRWLSCKHADLQHDDNSTRRVLTSGLQRGAGDPCWPPRPGAGAAGGSARPRPAAARAQCSTPAGLQERRPPGRPLREHAALSRATALVAGGRKLDDARPKPAATAPSAPCKSRCGWTKGAAALAQKGLGRSCGAVMHRSFWRPASTKARRIQPG